MYPAMQPRENQRGQYGDSSWRSPAVNLGILGFGVALGLTAWPSVTRRNPVGFIALSASGSMVGVSLTELLFGGL